MNKTEPRETRGSLFVRPPGLSLDYTAGCVTDEFLKLTINLRKTIEHQREFIQDGILLIFTRE